MVPGSTASPRSYVYFPGCSLKATGIAYDESMRTLFRLLGLGLEELPDWNCCGATSYMAIDEASAFILAARNLAIAQRNGASELLAPCAACYLVLRKTVDYVAKYPEVRRDVAAAMTRAGLPFPDRVRVRHPLEVLTTDVGEERIQAAVTREWPGGRIACYYGCQVVRPYSEVDQAYNPTRMDELLGAAGIPTVEYALKTKCCGGSLTGTITEVGKRLSYSLLHEAVRKGAVAIVTICPLCQFNLDAYQAEIPGPGGRPFDVPILLLPQLLGWAFGGGRKELGFHRMISGQRVIHGWFHAPAEKLHA
ncbi:MAG: CoB--CoM heterodisulfide reductase iron-sulfur subunit B family protein [Bacteroidales bacterium]